MKAVGTLFLTAICAAGMGFGCTFFTPSHTRDISNIAGCVLVEAATVAPGRIPTATEALRIAEKCGAANADAVIDLIRAKRQAEKREMLLQ